SCTGQAGGSGDTGVHAAVRLRERGGARDGPKAACRSGGSAVTQHFFEHPILNSPYGYPARHWELVDGQPTNKILETRRRSELITPVLSPRSGGRSAARRKWSSTRARAFRARSRSTTRHRSSTKSAPMWIVGATCPIRTSGR